jgi:hypothetical protein
MVNLSKKCNNGAPKWILLPVSSSFSFDTFNTTITITTIILQFGVIKSCPSMAFRVLPPPPKPTRSFKNLHRPLSWKPGRSSRQSHLSSHPNLCQLPRWNSDTSWPLLIWHCNGPPPPPPPEVLLLLLLWLVELIYFLKCLLLLRVILLVLIISVNVAIFSFFILIVFLINLISLFRQMNIPLSILAKDLLFKNSCLLLLLLSDFADVKFCSILVFIISRFFILKLLILFAIISLFQCLMLNLYKCC